MKTVQSTKDKLKKDDNLQNKQIDVKKSKKIKKIIIICVIVIALIVFALVKSGMFSKISAGNNLNEIKYSTYTVKTRTITQSLTSSGTLQPNDSYTINALVSGEILYDHFEEGDIVAEDQLLYEIDPGEHESKVKRARNSLKNAQRALDDGLEKLENLNVKSENNGIIQKLYVEVGDEISQGQKIADVIDKNTMCIDIPFVASEATNFKIGDAAKLTFETFETLDGYVSEISNVTDVNAFGVITKTVTIKVSNAGSITNSSKAYAQIGDAVCTESSVFYYNDEGAINAKTSGEVIEILANEGDFVNKNQIVIVLSSSDLENQIESLQLSVEDAESNLEDALDAYENYNITSPISGTVISKEYKAGDTLGSSSGQGSSTMAVIYDMSAFKFTMNIDELDIDKLKVGQEVVVTSDAREGKIYKGVVSNVSIQGSTTNGTTVYPVTVTIYNTPDESQTVDNPDGTQTKVYNTGKTSVVKLHSLKSKVNDEISTTYTYSDSIVIKKVTDENKNVSYYKDNRELYKNNDGTYSDGTVNYSFSEDFDILSTETFDESKMLRPGMNINAEIFVEKAENVIAVPVSAVLRGYKVKVFITAQENNTQSENSPNFEHEKNKKPQDLNSNTITADEYNNCQEVQVEIGINDSNYIEIKSGLSVGDVVVLDAFNAISISGSSDADYGQFGGMGGGMMYGGGMPGGYSGGMRPGGMR